MSVRRLWAVAVTVILAACAVTPEVPHYSDASRAERLQQLLPADIILLGEQHDAPDHQQVHRIVVETLASKRLLAALALEMASQGLDRSALETQQQNIRTGHCDMLPASQIAPMTRVQIARDIAMAETLAKAVQAGKTVVLLAGGGHVDRRLGVPLHLAPRLHVKAVLIRPESQPDPSESALSFDAFWPAQAAPVVDYCAKFGASRRPPN